MSLERDVIHDLEHRHRDRDPFEVPTDGLEMLDGFDLVHDVELSPPPAHHGHVREGLEAAAEPALGLADSLCHGSDLAVLGGREGHDPVGFPEPHRPQHDTFVAVGGHLVDQPLIRVPSAIRPIPTTTTTSSVTACSSPMIASATTKRERDDAEEQARDDPDVVADPERLA